MDENALKYLGNLLFELMHFYYDVAVDEYVYNTLKSVDGRIFKSKGLKDLKRKFLGIKDKIPYFVGVEEFTSMLIDYNFALEYLNDGEAIVYSMKDKFGFVKNETFSKGIYFSISDIDFTVQLGDVVRLGDVYLTPRGYVVKDMKFIRKFF